MRLIVHLYDFKRKDKELNEIKQKLIFTVNNSSDKREKKPNHNSKGNNILCMKNKK